MMEKMDRVIRRKSETDVKKITREIARELRKDGIALQSGSFSWIQGQRNL